MLTSCFPSVTSKKWQQAWNGLKFNRLFYWIVVGEIYWWSLAQFYVHVPHSLASWTQGTMISMHQHPRPTGASEEEMNLTNIPITK